MGIGEAFINVQLVVQKFIHIPLLYDKKENRFLANPKMASLWPIKIWHIGNLFITMVQLFSIGHLVKLIKLDFDHNRSSEAYREEILIYVFTILITTQSNITWYTMEKDPKWFAHAVNEALRSCDIKYRGWPNKKRIPNSPEIICYILSLSFLFFPVAAVILPIIRKYDPINRMFMLLIPILSDTQRVVLVIIAYLLSCLFGAVSSLVLILTHANSKLHLK
ncbi:unnamed protein product [Orchesella dallaii]|uniref:Uncharacterized protein n=1 Tax=Orchesella dallaii TaxID=48710 RepID=A0ABP1QM34_9HEXA